MSQSLELRLTPQVKAVLQLGDTCLIHAQRLAEWCGHGPVLEEDIAFSNLALDLLGQARALLTRAGQLHGQGGAAVFSEDQLAYLRDERQFFNLTLVEQPMRRSSAHAPGGDFADAVLRNFLLACWLGQQWKVLVHSDDAQLAGIAAKALKETRYHQQHAGDWVIRLGDGTEESAARLRRALERNWPYTAEMFAGDPAWAALREPWLADVRAVFEEARLAVPAPTPFVSTGSDGLHSEHLGFMLAEMQYLQRQHPAGRW
ncbi:MAG TPA: 1,2-phenylacetyl-CoA epoxidase subunit PaaC [Rubrivivax sp.]|nr:1,2-phenylacetyl-CoA epoxidase subunit PaaC [Rubrivivax sp.]